MPGANTIETSQMDDRERAFLEAAMPHLDVVYRVARHTSRDHHQAEDLVQETYLRAFAAFASHRGPSTKAWLVTICLNLARSEGRRRARRVVETSLPEHHEPEARRGERARGSPGQRRPGFGLSALAQLPEEQRLAIVLMDLAGHSASEVAEMLGCPRNTVLSRVFRGRQRLASLLVGEDINRDVP